MKSLSASLIVFAGMLTFVAGAFVSHSDTALFVMLVGGVVAFLGLMGWGACILPFDEP